MRLLVTKHNIGVWAANYVCDKINRFKPTASRPFVLCLPTGSTPIAMYPPLIALYLQKKVSFEDVITFNMDEYVGVLPEHPQSYHYYMYNNFFKHINIKKENINILDGNAVSLIDECQRYEKKIKDYGSINLLLGGVGEDGHIAFNEPGSSLGSQTRIKTLNHSTVVANSRFFENDITQTPTQALTIGIQTVLDANEVLILANGIQKASAVRQAIEGGVSSMFPVSALQLHQKVALLCDELATFELKVKTIKYFEAMRDDYFEFDQRIVLEG